MQHKPYLFIRFPMVLIKCHVKLIFHCTCFGYLKCQPASLIYLFTYSAPDLLEFWYLNMGGNNYWIIFFYEPFLRPYPLFRLWFVSRYQMLHCLRIKVTLISLVSSGRKYDLDFKISTKSGQNFKTGEDMLELYTKLCTGSHLIILFYLLHMEV